MVDWRVVGVGGGELKFPLLCAAKVVATLMTIKCAVEGLSVSRSPFVFNLAVIRNCCPVLKYIAAIRLSE